MTSEHLDVILIAIATRMKSIVDQGQAAGWSQQQYRAEMRNMLSELRQEMRNGNIGLNTIHRPKSIQNKRYLLEYFQISHKHGCLGE